MKKVLCLQLFKTFILLIVLIEIKGVVNYQEIQNSPIPIRIGNDCDLRVNNDHEFQTCRSRVYEDWYTYDRTQQIKYDCCFNWDIIDCQEKSILRLCDKDQYEDEYKNFWVKKEEYIFQHQKYRCSDYPYGSATCRFPIWGIVLIVFAALLVVSALVTICHFVRKRSRHNRREKIMT